MKVKYLACGMEKFFKKDKEYESFICNGHMYVVDDEGTPWYLHPNGCGYVIYCGVVNDKKFAEFI